MNTTPETGIDPDGNFCNFYDLTVPNPSDANGQEGPEVGEVNLTKVKKEMFKMIEQAKESGASEVHVARLKALI